MTVATPARRRAHAVRRGGYVIGALVNAALLVAVNVWPGWAVVPFLTSATTQVLPLVNASLLAGLIANLVYTAAEPSWLRALGDLVTTGIGLAALIALWRVFPFDVAAPPGKGSGWPLHWGDLDWGYLSWPHLIRVVLVIAIAGSALGVVGQTARLARDLARAGTDRRDDGRWKGGTP